MEAVIAALSAIVAAVVMWFVRGYVAEKRTSSAERKAKEHVKEAKSKSESILQETEERREQLEDLASAEADRVKADADSELKARRAETARLEERLLQKDESLEAKHDDFSRREQALTDRERNLEHAAKEIREKKREHIRELERVAKLSSAQARQALLKDIESDVRHESGKLIRQMEEEVRHEADRRARNILAACMQRIAAGHAAETTVSVVTLPSDDMKGRIIGKEGRNIRALTNLTGVDFIIDDTPSTVVLSCFDGVRREIAKLALERLIGDGRIHPASIEEMYYKAKSEIEKRIIEEGEQATFEVDVQGLHPEIVKFLGRMKYRTSYGQNLLAHSVECSRLAALLAEELGASSTTAKRSALLHDIGKVVSHEIEGPHATVGGELARRYKEPEAVAHAVEAHHNEVEPRSVEAVIVQVADALSGSRPGARGESLEHYIKRLEDLEEIAAKHEGVEKVYAIQAGREVRVMVSPEDVDDDEVAAISRKIVAEIEESLEYPGQIKITVIRESRVTEYAK